MGFQKELEQKVIEIEQILEKYLPAEEGYQKTVIEAMNYSLLAGGKRLRPLLTTESAAVFGGTGAVIEPFAAALEMIHTYSLVHDDLPAMDNDMYRRGKKTTHVVYGEAMAILAGDGLLNYAFETACKAFTIEPGQEAVGKALTVLASKAGVYGMIGGQVADVEAEKRGLAIDEKKLLYIHEHKTAALIQASFMIGAILAGATDADVKLLEIAAYNIGMAFQIQDDILDVTSSLEVLGKPIGSDEKNNKLTYVKAYGLEQAKADVESMSSEAIEILQRMNNRNIFLEDLVQHLITREK